MSPGRTARMPMAIGLSLAAALVAYPAFRSLPFFGDLAPRSDVRDWWVLWTAVFAGHWCVFGICTLALRTEGLRWSTIGLDFGWFGRHSRIIIAVLILVGLAAVLAPSLYYGGTPPAAARTNPLGPVTVWQRLAWIPLSITAGIVEEAVYRGFAITQVRRWIPNAWIAAVLVVPSFVLLHGIPTAPLAVQYAVVGALFGTVFVWLGLRRLEILVIVHTAIDVVFALLP